MLFPLYEHRRGIRTASGWGIGGTAWPNSTDVSLGMGIYITYSQRVSFHYGYTYAQRVSFQYASTYAQRFHLWLALGVFSFDCICFRLHSFAIVCCCVCWLLLFFSWAVFHVKECVRLSVIISHTCRAALLPFVPQAMTIHKCQVRSYGLCCWSACALWWLVVMYPSNRTDLYFCIFL